MGIKCKGIWLLVTAVLPTLFSCGGRTGFSVAEEQDELAADSVVIDTLTEVEEELGLTEEQSPQLDGVFDDFLFAYLHSKTLRQERTARPVRLEHAERGIEELEDFNPEFELAFLSGESFTTLYGNAAQMLAQDDEEAREDSVVSLQRINLNDETIRNFCFQRLDGQWKLTTVREATFSDDDLSDFLVFYARFCKDSVFQHRSISDPLRIVMQEGEDDGESIDGTIDADQWHSFCPEVPSGIISNIRRGQHYGGHRVVMRKSGLSNGLQEIFTFTKERNGWKLTKYEN